VSAKGVSHIQPRIGSAHTLEAESLKDALLPSTCVFAQKMRAPT
jgi:hypothetical protein